MAKWNAKREYYMESGAGANATINLVVMGDGTFSNYCTSGDSITLTNNTWIFCVFIWDGTKSSGSKAGCAAAGSYPAFSANSVVGTVTNPYQSTNTVNTMGVLGGAISTAGSIDELGWWNSHALTSAEVTALYNAGAGKTYYTGAYHNS